MNLQEREQLSHFLQQLTQASTGQKDAEAEALIRDAGARQPDAAYLLVQRAMQLEQALQMVQSQASKLQAEMDQMRSSARTGFLDQPNSWGRQAVQAAPGAALQPQFQPQFQPQAQAQAQAPQFQAPQAASPAASSWGSGMLGNVATTAAGVVAGSLLFQGIGNLMGHHQTGQGFGANAAQPMPTPTTTTENTVINNYYDGSGPGDAEDAIASTDGGDSGDSA
jgi:hypothetical protein